MAIKIYIFHYLLIVISILFNGCTPSVKCTTKRWWSAKASLSQMIVEIEKDKVVLKMRYWLNLARMYQVQKNITNQLMLLIGRSDIRWIWK